MPDAASASRTVAPAARRTSTICAPSARASTTSMRIAVDLVGAARERIDHAVSHLREQRLKQRGERPARELVLHRELDLAGLAERLEAPRGGEVAERPLDERHVDRFRRAGA